jgi:putative tryptophan/tyrosine transport system substrate-binding protein
LAAELADRKVDVIVASGGPAPARAAKSATSAIPIVFATSGNLTGVSVLANELIPKRIELLTELVPQVKLIGVLVNPMPSNTDGLQGAARAKGLQLQILNARNEDEIDAAFTTFVQSHVGAVLVGADLFFFSRREQLVGLAAHHTLPTMYEWREFAVAGGLISYGSSRAAAYHQVGIYAGRILKGAKPADLPVQQPTTFELVINLKTAKALDLTIPQMILARADEVIE